MQSVKKGEKMASVTSRIDQIKQPHGGYIKPSTLEVIQFEDKIELNQDENIHGSIVGSAVEYLTKFMLGSKPEDAFEISLLGAKAAESFGREYSLEYAKSLLADIKGLDNSSIKTACKLVTFDVWYRNVGAALFAENKNYSAPNKNTISNIKVMVQRSLDLFNKYGPVTKASFTFESPELTDDDIIRHNMSGKWVCGGYTKTVNCGDGDFLTKDTIWDFKVMNSKPTSKHTLQLLMYWIMGQHSGQIIFKGITKIGIFNPRSNTAYMYKISDVTDETIKEVEKDIICYE